MRPPRPLDARKLLPLALVLLSTADVSADEEASRCAEVYTTAQRLQKAARLKEAMEALAACSKPRCPRFIHQDCLRWHAEVEEALPSVVIDARDASGKDVLDVRVLDGQTVLAERLTGTALPLDPGEHTLRFEHGASVETRVVLLKEGERRRKVEVIFQAPPGPAAASSLPLAPPASAPPPPPPRVAPAGSRATPALIAGGTGALLLLGAGALGWYERRELQRLRDTCAPYCEQEALDRVKRGMLVADVAGGIGAVALGVGALLWVYSPARSTASVTLGGGWASIRLKF